MDSINDQILYDEDALFRDLSETDFGPGFFDDFLLAKTGDDELLKIVENRPSVESSDNGYNTIENSISSTVLFKPAIEVKGTVDFFFERFAISFNRLKLDLLRFEYATDF